MKSFANHLTNVQPTTIALISFAYFLIVVTALYFLHPAYGLVRSFVGNYDLGGYEFIIASTFLSLGLGSLALVVGLHQEIPKSSRPWIGLFLVVIWGMGMLIAGIFPANDGGSTVPHRTTALLAGIFPVEVQATPETGFSFIHIIAILGALFSLSLAAIVWSWRFKHEERWRSICPYSFILALVMIAASILLFLAIFLFIPTEFAFNLSLNLLTFSGLLWLFLVAAHLRFVVLKPFSK